MLMLTVRNALGSILGELLDRAPDDIQDLAVGLTEVERIERGEMCC
jgi:hypothetical protein